MTTTIPEPNAPARSNEMVGTQRSIPDLREAYRRSPTFATAQSIIDETARLPSAAERQTSKLMILRSYTVEPIAPLLRASAALEGVDLRIEVGRFNAYAQEILDPSSRLYAFAPDLVLIAVQTCDLLPLAWSQYVDDPEAAERQAAEAIANLRSWVATLRERSAARVLLQGLELPDQPSAGILDRQNTRGQSSLIESVNADLRRIAEESDAVDFVDYDALVARHGRARWRDEGKFATTRMPITAEHLPHVAAEYLPYVLAAAGRLRKVLVIDLDNTIWGGVIGEAGIDGIRLGHDYPGAGYRALQRAILDLHHRGIVLAISSKNDERDALDALERHPRMLLRPAHFAAMRINWNDKAQSIIEIAAELNLTLDSIAFLDESPVERERVSRALPEVLVIPLSDRPMEYARELRDSRAFERVAISNEDRERGRLYVEERMRSALRTSAASLEDFYRSLEMSVDIAALDDVNLARVAQLTLKTNQFNVTTRRYNEKQLLDLRAAGARVYALTASDRYGENGIVGVAIVVPSGDTAEIDTFLMSCRVVGRTIETALLSHIAAAARSAGARTLYGVFVPTKKNGLAKTFYPDHGFVAAGTEGDATRWELDLAAAPSAPPWIKVRSEP
ncbi:MAG TPA: HAD-IIIC family phosphatase [Candidatus Polarisedimenticolia bacterium]|nr:HAD-IIIC family phosphatase [Candidatus Polarisedimenticolia bacterium]